MASGETLAIAAQSVPQGWNPRTGIVAELSELCLDSYLSQNLFRIGIYGWRKRCLYFLVILLSSLVVVNLSLTIWIIKVLGFTMDGMGRLRIHRNGLRLEGESAFLRTLYAAEIYSRQDHPLKVESSRNITIHTRNSQGKVTNRLHLGDSKMEVLTNHFVVRGPKGQLLLYADDQEVVMAAERMRVTGKGGVTFDGSVQTHFVTSEPAQQLRLESPTRQVRLAAPEGIRIESRAGPMQATCMKDLKLKSREGSIILNSEHLEFRNLRTVIPTRRGRSYPGIFEMCSCQDGRLFLSPPDGGCVGDDTVCN